jgi:hypothetical protein
VLADRAYDAERKIRQPLRRHSIEPLIARRNTEHDSGLGKNRPVVEWVFAWLFKYRRLRVRYEKRFIHSAANECPDSKSVYLQSDYERAHPPVCVRYRMNQSSPKWTATVLTGHVNAGSSLVQEGKPLELE